MVTIYVQDGIQHYMGLSTDTKPTPVDPSSTFFELDTKKAFIFDQNNANPATDDGWWEV